MKKSMAVLISGILCLGSLSAIAQTQIELNDTASEKLKKADDNLNALYKQLVPTLSEAQKTLLKTAQLAWIKYRDLCAAAEASIYEGGSCQPMIHDTALEEITLEKNGRLYRMLPEQREKAKAAPPGLEAANTAFQKADAELNAVYKTVMNYDFPDTVKKAVKQTEVAWIAYRDACAQSEAALYPPSMAPALATQCNTELTQARIARLKSLFIEGYPEEETTTP